MLVIAHDEVCQHAERSVFPRDHNRPSQSAQNCRQLLFLALREFGGNGLSKHGSKRLKRMWRPNARHVRRRPLSE
jgi:hypothetical protein